MQFIVPQFIERKPKIFGPFTFGQFVAIGGSVAVSMVLFFLLPYNLFVIAGIIIVGGTALFVFLKAGGEPLPVFFKNLAFFSSSQRIYIWNKSGGKAPAALKKQSANKIIGFFIKTK